LFLKKIIKIIFNNYESKSDIIEDSPRINFYPPSEWQSLKNAELFSLVNDYFTKYNKCGRLWGFRYFFTHPFIKPESMDLAIQKYADYDPKEEVPLLFVNNLGFRTTGIVITNK